MPDHQVYMPNHVSQIRGGGDPKNSTPLLYSLFYRLSDGYMIIHCDAMNKDYYEKDWAIVERPRIYTKELVEFLVKQIKLIQKHRLAKEWDKADKIKKDLISDNWIVEIGKANIQLTWKEQPYL